MLVKDTRLNKDVKAFQACKRILDLGCGQGEFLSKCRVEATGIDGSEYNVAECKKKGIDALRFVLPAELPFPDGTFDGVYCSHFIEHFLPGEAELILSEADRVLKTDGLLLVRSPLFGAGFFDDPTHVRPYHLQSVLHMLGGWEQPGERQSIMGVEQPKYSLLSYYEEKYPFYVSKVSPTIAPSRFPLRLGLRGLAHGLASLGLGKKGAYGALLRKSEGE